MNLNSYDFNWLSAKLGCVWILINLRGFLLLVSLLDVKEDIVVDDWILPFELLFDLLSVSSSRKISWYIFSNSVMKRLFNKICLNPNYLNLQFVFSSL
jgi:hypothetical protein